MRIIPAIDIIGGKCVRLTKGDYSTQKIYSENPLHMAKIFEDAGIQYLHVVDLDGAKAKQIVNYKILEVLASQTNLNVDFGGGIKSENDIKTAFECGAKQITVGSIAAQNQDLMLEWLMKYGAEKIILGADCKNRRIATNGWLENSNLDVISFIKDYENKGAKYSIVTDIDKDGMLSGPAFELYEEILTDTTISLIASGGITTIEDVQKLKNIGCEGAIIGKAIYEGTINLKGLSELC
ncbi:1-(5-phosphoribosyl)-5-[(5-phosphoribosylamino)methylideneamino]imidazole-4-carboxamide isomerase [Chryseobacterium sp. VAUSW3]|uniref:1-(5-phosphoribosyl)-5-[(5- phosphoribosylamino)methylideneamino]imidazole-4- carboxamide isomerase n=1 Tax=Chryseobacterium sp. VAUSW3 TaxID=2010998 RepID=UPI000B4D255B|nr:1-(5-phosphoribosyl)-5-[(5-phosphoribosylamino)methylideneamino]imidazole-4-carboxamide isomerase [Chryseobacterium sp. VAUSW3]OWR14425.1 1-(5-phosphoribosyl)-5-[(5-phosphoribosylamino)methylideneamino]imidazole-4-carboxamide isomerase [Chryseobacterium sp. VAUSW3]